MAKKQPERYQNLVREIDRIKAWRIVEIGTCAGVRAELMIRAALKHHEPNGVHYRGFDLFGPSPGDELSPRVKAPSMLKVKERLVETGANVWLYKGDTRETLPKAAQEIKRKLKFADIIFVDGGHSEETVRADWMNIQPIVGPETVVMMDDYWNYPGGGGCKPVVEELAGDERWRVELLEPIDVFPRSYGELRTQIAKVVRKR